MSVEFARRFLLWCTIVNYGVLIVWFWGYVFVHDPLFGLLGQWYHLSLEQFDVLNYGLIGVYKVGILLFNIVPLVVLYILRARRDEPQRG